MTFEDAMNALVAAGLLDSANVAAAISILESPSVENTYPGWAEALAKAGLIEEADVEAAAAAIEKKSKAIAEDDDEAFDDALRNAGIL